MKLTTLLFLLGSLFLTCSCGSQRQLSKSPASTEELSQKFGFKIHKKDNLRLYTEASTWLGTPYRYGGTTRQGVDCSGLISNLYLQVYQKRLERTAAEMARKNCRKTAKSNLREGDLVFFNTAKKKKGINHVGLYLKNGYFIHATTSKGVIISNLREEYYTKKWKQGGIVK